MPTNNDPSQIFGRHSAYTSAVFDPASDPLSVDTSVVANYSGRKVTCTLVSPVNLENMKRAVCDTPEETLKFQKIAVRSLKLQEEAKEALKAHQAHHWNRTMKDPDLSGPVRAYLKEAVGKPLEEVLAHIPDISKIDLKTYNAHGHEKEPLLQTINSVLDREEKSADPEETHAASNLRAILRVFASYNWFSFDNKGSAVKVVFNYGKDIPNAAFTGTALVFGRHVNSPYFGSTLDDRNIAGHEFTHEVVEEIAKLIYYKQPGILNEHFADIFGKISDLLAESLTIEDAERDGKLLVGDNWIKDYNGVKYAIRSFPEPGKALGTGESIHPLLGADVQSSTLSDYVDIEEDEGGVHQYSGALNHAFYLAAKELGGASWWHLGAVWFLALFSLKPNANFSDFTKEVVKAAETLFGEGKEKKAIVNAFIEIGAYDQNFKDPAQFTQAKW